MMDGLIAGDTALFRTNSGVALRVGLGIAAGIVFSSTVVGLIRPILHRRHFRRESAAPEDKK